MCTLSWCAAAGGRGYHLFFNRDEQKSREPADPPALIEIDGTPVLAPRDGRSGGTWLLANGHGLSVALLNHYAASPPADQSGQMSPTSRGQLVLELGSCRDCGEFRARVPERVRAGRYPPFLLFAIDPSAAVALWRWDGIDLVEASPPAERFLTTSSFRPAEVLAARQRARATIGADAGPAELRDLHLQHDPGRGAHSIRMRRPDAQTLSYSEIAVGKNEVSFRYRPEPIDGLELGAELVARLPLRVAV